MKPINARRLSPKAQEDLRLRVIHAIVDQGMRQVDAVRYFGVGRTSIHNWLKTYQKEGISALRAKKRGRPPHSRLAGHQAATTVRIVTDRCPDQMKLPFALWTRDAVRQLLADRFDVHVSVWTVGRYLNKWGFSPQKPLRRAYERDPRAVRRWLKREYPSIRKQAKAENAEIHWGDEMGMRSDHHAGRTYGLKGKTPIIPGPGKRFGCNMISTITNRGRLAFMVFKTRFTTTVAIDFLRRLVRHSRKKVFLIWDGHPVHRSIKVKKWIKKNQEQIRVFFLPSYSPELNPDELLNQDVKSNAVGRRRVKDQSEMISNVRSYLWSTQRRPDIVKSYFNEEHVRYAAS
jgi:transposase